MEEASPQRSTEDYVPLIHWGGPVVICPYVSWGGEGARTYA